MMKPRAKPFAKPFAIASVSALALMLAACGDDQTAQQDEDLVEGDTTVTQSEPEPGAVPQPESPPGDVAEEPARPNMGNPVMPGEEDDAGIAATETPPIQPEADPDERLLAEDAPEDDATDDETPADEVDETASVPAEAGVSIEPGVYESGLATMRLEQDGQYVIEMNAEGEELAGTDRLEGNILAAAPMPETPAEQDANCVFSNEAGGLRVTASDPSCAFLDGEVFQRVE